METLERIITEYMEQYPPAGRLFDGLKKLGNLYLIGGVLREYLDHQGIIELRDVDIVVDVPLKEYEKFLLSFQPERNCFGGYKINCDGLLVDVWHLNQTWAYVQEKVKCAPEERAVNLPQTVFLNMDGLVYDLKNNQWNDAVYRDAVKSGVLDVVLADNPQIALNILRGLIIRKKYNMKISDRLKEIICAYCAENPDAVEELYQIQCRRYGKEVVTRDDIAWEVGHF